MIRRVCVPLLLLLSTAQEPSGGARVTIPSGGWVLVGNYAAPAGRDSFPAVLLLNGAARDRRAYVTLARELTTRGIASLRLDLRGEGESINLGRFEPGQSAGILANSHEDVTTALRWLRGQPRVDGTRIGVLGASYSAEAAARAARSGAAGSAYVALSPGDFSDESIRAIDSSGLAWWFIASTEERFAHRVVRDVAARSRSARTTFVEGTSHASDILSPHHFLNAEIADWFAARLASRSAPETWGRLEPGAFGVGFTRRTVTRAGGPIVIDTWYPTHATGASMSFETYLRLSTDLRGATDGFPDQPGSLAASLSAAMSGDPHKIDRVVVDRILTSRMAAVQDAPPAAGRFPLAIWTPRYATTVAQSVLSEYLASRGYVVAFARPQGREKLPFEAGTTETKLAELRERVADIRTAIGDLQSLPHVNAARIGVLAWSYTGEMATQLQLVEPRVTLVAGLSTTLLNDWVFQPGNAIADLDPARLTAVYAVLTQRGQQPGTPPPILGRLSAGYFIEFPSLAHGSFNTLEGFIPSLFGIHDVQRWSTSSDAGAAGYEAAAVILERLLRHHVKTESPVSSRLALTTGLAAGTVDVHVFDGSDPP